MARMKKRPRRRNPIAKALRDPAFRPRRTPHPRAYHRKTRKNPVPPQDDA